MKLKLENLQGKEQEEFLKMRDKYIEYDKVDFLIHKTLKSLGIPLEDFLNRKKKSKIIKNSCYLNRSSPQNMNIDSEVLTE